MTKEIPAVRTIDVTPTWRAIVPILLMGIENGNADGRKIAMEEIYRMADAADAFNKLPRS
jgi:hypothetical protein